MNKYAAVLLDYISLYEKNKKMRKAGFFACQGVPLRPGADDDAFYAAPDTPDLAFTERERSGDYVTMSYSYPSPVLSADSENNQAAGIRYSLAGQGTGKDPVSVILIHGWRSSRLDRIQNIYLERLQSLGYELYFPFLPYHFTRVPRSSAYSGEFTVSADVDRTLLSVRQAVAELRALLYWIRRHRGGRIVVIGLSLGGMLANLLSTLESFDALVSVVYLDSLAYTIWHTALGRPIRRHFLQEGFTYEQLRQHWAIIEPSRRASKLSREQILLISGIYDQHVHLQDAQCLWEAWDRPERLLYKCGHSGMEFCKEQIRDDSIAFIQNVWSR